MLNLLGAVTHWWDREPSSMSISFVPPVLTTSLVTGQLKASRGPTMGCVSTNVKQPSVH